MLQREVEMIYLDNAATTRFKPNSVLESYCNDATHSSNSGRGGHSDCMDLASKIYRVREDIKDYVGAGDSYEVIFTSNCTDSLNLAILGYLRDKKGHVITTMLEHNSTIRPLHHLEINNNITVTYLKPDENGYITANMIENVLQSDTLLISICHTSNVTGVTQCISEIGQVAKKHNIKLLIDSAQSLGHHPIDMEGSNIDMLAGCGHKGLQAMQGIGFLVVKNDTILTPIKYGGTGTDSHSLTQPTIVPEGYECGTLNSPAIVSLTPAIKWLRMNEANTTTNLNKLSKQLISGLSNIRGVKLYSKYPSTVISFSLHDSPSTEIADMLNYRGFAVRSGLHCAPLAHKYLETMDNGLVRMSIGNNNNSRDIMAVLVAIESISREIENYQLRL